MISTQAMSASQPWQSRDGVGISHDAHVDPPSPLRVPGAGNF
jgi:hypothetical protein